MPKFKVPIVSDNPQESMDALSRAGLQTIPLIMEVDGAPESRHLSRRFNALAETEDAGAAEARVREAVGDGPEVGPGRADRRGVVVEFIIETEDGAVVGKADKSGERAVAEAVEQLAATNGLDAGRYLVRPDQDGVEGSSIVRLNADGTAEKLDV